MKRGTTRHPKLFDLMSILGIKHRPTAVGYLEMLWHFTAEFAPQGDIGRYSDDRIEGALDWTGKRGRLVEALTTSGWVDVDKNTRLLVHDWSEHADEGVRKKLKRAGLSFVKPAQKVSRQIPTVSANPPHPCPPRPEPVPEPVPERETPPDTVATPEGVNGNGNHSSLSRFSEWIARWPRVPNSQRALKAFTTCWTEETDAEIFACRDRFLESKDAADGIIPNPEKFLMEQKVNNWSGRWPPRSPPKAPKEKSLAERTMALMQGRIDRGESPI